MGTANPHFIFDPSVRTPRVTVDSKAMRSVIAMLQDSFAILLAAVIVIVLKARYPELIPGDFEKSLKIPNAEVGLCALALFISLFLWISSRCGLYATAPITDNRFHLSLIAHAVATTGLSICGICYLLSGSLLSRPFIVSIAGVSSLTVWAGRAYLPLLRAQSTANVGTTRRLAILGCNELCRGLSKHITHNPWLGYKFAGFIRFPGCNPGSNLPPSSILGNLADIDYLKREHFLDEIVVAEYCSPEFTIDLIDRARNLRIDVRAIAGYYGELTVDAPIEYLGLFPVMTLHRCKSRPFALQLKRAGDIVLSAFFLLALFIPMALIAIAVWTESEGPILFLSKRVGRKGLTFTCFKFRTMVPNAEGLKKDLMTSNERDGVLFKLKDDPRITRLGRFLRKYSLDELPQLVNVLLGQMSLVGPRPPLPPEVENYNLEQLQRLDVMPGLTGLWQVQARQDSSFAKYIELDLAYIENWSLWLDFQILLRTAEVVLRGTGC